MIAEAVDWRAGAKAKVSKGKRAEKIGVVASDKMTKTVIVRVDRLGQASDLSQVRHASERNSWPTTNWVQRSATR